MFTLDIAVNDALFRIRREYERTDGEIYLSFSGGKDSTILAELIKLADLPTQIPFVFANTGIEMNATTDFVREYNWSNKIEVKPRKPFGVILKDYGKPAISKIKSEHLATHQRNRNNPLGTTRQKHLILGEAYKGGVPLGFKTRVALAIKDFHFLHPKLGYRVSNKCCLYLKKYPFIDFAKQNNMKGTFTGVRIVEGGARSLQYKSCVEIKKLNGKDYLMSMPIFDWTDEICNEFIKLYNVKLSKAYVEYGMDRTGCIGCPFSRNLEKDLEILYIHEPLKYKACMKWLRDVYVDQGVKCEWDSEYMEHYDFRQAISRQYRKEMLDKYSQCFNPEIRKNINPRE